MTTAHAPVRPPLLLRAARRLWRLRRTPDPLTEILALAFYRGDFLPNSLISSAYMAWQSARVPRWDAAGSRHVLGFSARLFARSIASALRPGRAKAFHRIETRGLPAADAHAVLHVIPSFEIGGSEKIVLDLLEGLGHRFRMRVLTGRTARHAVYEGLDLRVATTPAEIKEELRRRPPGLIHFHYWGPNRWTEDFFGALGEAGLGVPVVGNMNNPVAPLLHPLLSHHVFVSRHAAGLEPRAAGPSSVIYPGTSPEAWLPRPAGPERPYPTIGMVYRLSPEKLDLSSIDALIDAVRLEPRTRVLIPGGGPYLPEFVKRVSRAGLRANFHFLGWVPFRELPALYDLMDLFAAPVHSESFGVVVPYAMFKGVPVLAYRTGALPEILGGDEWLCSGREEFASRAAAMLRGRAAAREAARSLRTGAGRFTLTAMLEAYENLYRSLLP
ncbi:MAG: glycosyltransferase family 4 protein [Elusimicrobia bacterium]|nr:glycosyltransferase family 4 protein [Elusimicrobiota bacterium]